MKMLMYTVHFFERKSLLLKELFQFLFLKNENTAVCGMRHVSVDIRRLITVIRWPLIRLPDYLFLYHLLNPDKFEFQISNLTMINI